MTGGCFHLWPGAYVDFGSVGGEIRFHVHILFGLCDFDLDSHPIVVVQQRNMMDSTRHTGFDGCF